MADSEIKGHDAVMDAWPLIESYVPDAKLMIVGTGNDGERLRKRMRAEQLAGVESCGPIDDAQRDQTYCSCRMLFYPSRQEGFGLTGVEAASFGVPLLRVAGTVTEELFPTGTGAVIAKDLSRESIAEAAIPIVRNSQLARELGRAASARVNAVFLKEHFTDRFRQALAPLVFASEAVPTNRSRQRFEKKNALSSDAIGLVQNRQCWPRSILSLIHI